MRMRSIASLLVLLMSLVPLIVPLPAQASGWVTAPAQSPAFQAGCNLPVSDAEAIEIASNYSRGYWWDHTDLTVAVQAHPSATPEQLAAISGAIAAWSGVLDECFAGLITLTNVTGMGRNPHQAADIVLHYVPKAGGVVFAGMTVCGPKGCSNVLLSSEPPLGSGSDAYTPEELGWITLHELGHTLGLGHVTNIRESTDLMAYGWQGVTEPVLSQCDVDAIAFVFAWAIADTEPAPPGAGPYVCSQN